MYMWYVSWFRLEFPEIETLLRGPNETITRDLPYKVRCWKIKSNFIFRLVLITSWLGKRIQRTPLFLTGHCYIAQIINEGNTCLNCKFRLKNQHACIRKRDMLLMSDEFDRVSYKKLKEWWNEMETCRLSALGHGMSKSQKESVNTSGKL